MTRDRSIPMSLAALLLISAAPAQEIDDVRCLLASNAASKTVKNPDEKRAAEATMHFYLGRIDGKFSAGQLSAAFTSRLKSLNGANLGPTMQACFQHAQERMRFVQGVGQHLTLPRS